MREDNVPNKQNVFRPAEIKWKAVKMRQTPVAINSNNDQTSLRTIEIESAIV